MTPPNGGFQLRPAFESVGAREHQLSIVEREGRGIGAVVVRRDLVCRCFHSADEGVEQLLRLALELFEIGTRRKRAGWKKSAPS